MEERFVFIAKDGIQFDNKEDCLEWEQVCMNVKDLDEWMKCGAPMPAGLEEVKQDFEVDVNFDPGEFYNLIDWDCGGGPEASLQHFRRLNYISNFIFYGSANPCKA